MWILFVLLAAILLYIILTILFSLVSYRIMFCRHPCSLEYAKAWGLKRQEYTRAFLDLPWEPIRIYSEQRDTDIAGLTLRGKPPAGTVIILHGISWNRYECYKYARGFVDKGWNVVIFDLPGHGDSPRGRSKTPAFGYMEKWDLDKVVDWARDHYKHVPLVLVGVSMGAATVLQYAPIGVPMGKPRPEWKVDAIIADCSYSSAGDELRSRIKALHIPGLFGKPMYFLMNTMLNFFRGYTLEAISPKSSVLESPVPILFIHGKNDRYVPTEMSVSMAEMRKTLGAGPTELLLINGASHAKSVLVDPETWFKGTFDFIERYVKT